MRYADSGGASHRRGKTTSLARLLEDLTSYEQGDERRGLSTEWLGHCVEALAAMHAEWWQSPRLSGCDFLLTWGRAVTLRVAEGYAGCWDSFVDQYGHCLPASYEAFRPPLVETLELMGAALGAAPQTLAHGDFRADNIFFGGGRGRVVAIDWGLATRGAGVFGEVGRWRGGARRVGPAAMPRGFPAGLSPSPCGSQPRFQRPLPEPCVRFSLTRLSPGQSAIDIPRCQPGWPIAQAPGSTLGASKGG